MVADKIRADAEAARIESEWKFAAMVKREGLENKTSFVHLSNRYVCSIGLNRNTIPLAIIH